MLETNTSIQIFSDSKVLSVRAANLFSRLAMDAVARRGRFLVALSGGSTPQALYQMLAQSPYREQLPWAKIFIFFGDERCVLPDNPESCYYQAFNPWLSKVMLPQANIFRIRGELGPLAAAEDYAVCLKSMADSGMDWPWFDLVLLGLGQDGHTASLFPGSNETRGVATVAVSANYQDRPANRVSLTPQVINDARCVVFMVTGKDKAAALANTVAGARQLVLYPAQRVRPEHGGVIWLIDELAASLLPEKIDDIAIDRN